MIPPQDALGRTAQTYKYTIAGLILVESNIDSGERYHLTDVRNLPYLRWDGAGAAIGIGYDVARRIYYISDGSAFLELNVYGEALSSPATTNARKQKIATYDQSGLLKTDSFDFKGNLLSSTKRLANNWQTTVNWAPLYGLTDPAAIEAAAASLLESATFTETRAYDALNRVTSATTPDTSETKPTYNEAGMLEKVEVRVRGSVTWSPVVDDIDYDAKGQRQYIDYGNGTNTAYTYDALTFRLTRALTKRESDNATLQDLTYTYDPVGNVLAIADAAQPAVFFGANYVDASQLFEYDPTYRLTRAEGREHASLDTRPNNADFVSTIALPHPNSPQSLRRYVEVFTYNAVGSPTSHAHTPTGGTAWTRTYAYVTSPDCNRLLNTNTTETYTHDGHGNITAMPHLSAITWTTYDQMKSANLGGGGMVYFSYDIAGQRSRKVRHHVGGAIVEERIYLGAYEIYRKRVSGVLEVERQTLHLMDGVKRVAMVETKTVDTTIPGWTPVPRWRFQLDNHLGSACLEVDEVAAVIGYEEYHAYGTTAYQATKSGVDVSAKRYRYTGKERDEETGFHYHGARYYAAWLGRWVSADPLGVQAGINVYLYGRASPVVFTDPSGLEPISPEVEKDRGLEQFNPPPQTTHTPTAFDNAVAHTKERVAGIVKQGLQTLATVGGPDPFKGLREAMSEEYAGAGGGIRGLRNAINVLNPFYQVPKEIISGYEANARGDYEAAGRHTFNATSGIVGLAELTYGAFGGASQTPKATGTNPNSFGPSMAYAGSGAQAITATVDVSGTAGGVIGSAGAVLGGLVSMMTGDDDSPKKAPSRARENLEHFDLDEALTEGISGDDVPLVLRGGRIESSRRLGPIGPVKNQSTIRQLKDQGYDPKEFEAVQYEVAVQGGGQGIITVFESGGVYWDPHWSSGN